MTERNRKIVILSNGVMWDEEFEVCEVSADELQLLRDHRIDPEHLDFIKDVEKQVPCLIRQDGRIETLDLDDEGCIDFDAVRKEVGYIQVTPGINGLTLLVNEDGNAHGLPENIAATTLHARHPHPALVGTVAVIRSEMLR